MEKCNKCGELAVEENVNHNQEKVCTACGVVIEDIVFGSENSDSCTSSWFTITSHDKVRAARILNKSKPPAALIYGLERLHSLCQHFHISSNVESEVTYFLKIVYKEKRFKKKEYVATLAGCILYSMLKSKYGKPLPLIDIIHYLQCTKKDFSTYLNFYKSWLCKNDKMHPVDKDYECETMEETSESNVPKITEIMIKAVCQNALPEEKCKLMKLTMDVVKLAYACWLGTGRPSHGVVAACAYYCWKSLDPCNRRKVSFPTFCCELNIEEGPGARNRVSELKALLLKLGQNVPFYSENYVNERNLIFHFDTILQNSGTLRYDRLEGIFTSLRRIKEQMNRNEFNTFRSFKKRAPRKVSESAINYDSDMNASDIEINDSEIEEYINYGPQKKVIEEFCEKNVLENDN